MTHDDAKRLLAPLAAQATDGAGDVTAWVMRDVRRLNHGDADRALWRLAATCAGAAAALVVGVAVFATAVPSAENPLVEFATQATPALEAQ